MNIGAYFHAPSAGNITTELGRAYHIVPILFLVLRSTVRCWNGKLLHAKEHGVKV